MLLYVPVTRSDFHLAAPLFRWMKTLGGLGQHPMVVAFAQSGIPDVEAEAIRKALSSLGGSTFVIEQGNHPEYGWPRSANFIFQEAAFYAAQNQAHGQSCWYFYELDNVPLKPGWIDALQAEYEYRERPCMGVVNNTVRKGNRVTGKHLVGTAIYSPDIFHRASICKHLHLLGDPFDVALEVQIVPLTWDTKLIQHNWSTAKYRLEKDQAFCENAKDRPASKDYARPVTLGERGPLVVHGVKDTSLIRLLEKRFEGK
jgi:hypothetical protein